MTLIISTVNQLKEAIQDIAEQIQSLERKISRINQRDIDLDENVKLEENESNTFLKESVEKEVIHMNYEKVNKESTKPGGKNFCDMYNCKCKSKTTMENNLHKKQCELCEIKFMMECLLNNHIQ